MGVEVAVGVMAVGALVGAGATVYSAQQQQKQARKQANLQKREIERQKRAAQARARLAARRAQAMARLRGGAAGIGSGSLSPYLTGLESSLLSAQADIGTAASNQSSLVAAERDATIAYLTGQQIGAVGQGLAGLGQAGYMYGQRTE